MTLLFKTDATIYVGGLDEKVTETLLWELFLQGGPVGKWPKYSTFGMLIYFDEQLNGSGQKRVQKWLTLCMWPNIIKKIKVFWMVFFLFPKINTCNNVGSHAKSQPLSSTN